jgi:hypothetical protein
MDTPGKVGTMSAMSDTRPGRPPLGGRGVVPSGRGGATTRSRRLIKLAVAIVLVAGLGALFLRSVRDARSAPYTIKPEQVHGWTLVLEPPSSDPSDPVLVLRPPPDLASGLFHQVFRRVMESMTAPAAAGIPLVSQGELDGAFAGRATPETLLAAARSAGLDTVPISPQCLAHRRVSNQNATRQLYYVLFDVPAFDRFRAQLATLAGGGRAGFDPGALSPALFIATSDSTFNQWRPFHPDARADCVAPVVTAD